MRRKSQAQFLEGKGRTISQTHSAAKVMQQIQYQPEKKYLFLDQNRKLKTIEKIRNQIAKFDVKPKPLYFVNN